MGKTELKLEIDSDLLAEARRAGVPLAIAIEDGIRTALAQQIAPASEIETRAKEWAEENAEAIDAYRRRIDEFGVFGDDLRRW